MEPDNTEHSDGHTQAAATSSAKPAPPAGVRKRRIGAIAVAVLLGGGLLCAAIETVSRMREAAARGDCNLGGIAYALLIYHDEHGRFPPAFLRSPDGQPLLSWRVLILPYYGGNGGLYREFRLDEPWDSPHNIQLLKQMPSCYEPSWTRYVNVPAHHTVCRVLAGPGTAFEAYDGVPLDDFPDGSSNTLLFVEAGEPVPWTMPEAIDYDPDRPVQLRGLFRAGFRACSADGGYRFIEYDADQRFLHSIIRRNSGDDRPRD
jgi:hypothetical protein